MTHRILALEISGKAGSVAAWEEGVVLAQRPLPAEQRSAQSLAPAMQQALAELGWTPDSISAVAVTIGPGSFTGLRIGVTTAKTFAYATGAAVIGVNTLEVIARGVPLDSLPADGGELWAIIDAYRGQVFAGRFGKQEGNEQADGKWQWRAEPLLLGDAQWLARLNSGSCVTGPGLLKLASRLPAGVTVIDRTLWPPSAEQVARIAAERFAKGQRDDLWTLAPLYMRRSAAEEKRDAGVKLDPD